VYVIGAVPVQVPLAAVSAFPSCAIPDKLGATVFVGGVAAKAVAALRASATPANSINLSARLRHTKTIR
jgi:hypothetical protein